MYKFYTLSDKNNNIRYVGVTCKTLEERLKGHLRNAVREQQSNHRCCWIRKCISEGYKPIIKEILSPEINTWEDACREEKRLISFYRSIGLELVNTTDGGDGLNNPTEEVRSKISASLKEIYKSPEYSQKLSVRMKKLWTDDAFREKMSKRRMDEETRTRIALARRGKYKHTNEWRLMMSEKMKNRIFSEEHRHKLSIAQLGKPGRIKSQEEKEKMSQIMRGRRISEETRTKMSMSARLVKHKPHSEETKAKMSAAHKLRSSSDEIRKKMSERQTALWRDPVYRKSMIKSQLRR